MNSRSSLLPKVNASWRVLLVAAALHLAGAVRAEPPSLEQALSSNDVERLEQLARSPGSSADVARAVALSLRHRDAQARPALELAVASAAAPEERFAALQELAALNTRQGRYQAAGQALDAAARLKSLDGQSEQARRRAVSCMRWRRCRRCGWRLRPGLACPSRATRRAWRVSTAVWRAGCRTSSSTPARRSRR
jgi:hypothetical protein